MSGNNDENFYRNNNSASSSADVILSKQDAGHHTKNTTDDGDKPLARLLIVDDEYDIVQVLKVGLQQNGFLVNAFTNPQQALQSFKSNAESYSLLLSDVRMPGLSGMQLARKVKETNPDVKVVLMTAFEIKDNEFSKVFPSTQVDGFIQKPVHIRELTDKILSIIGQSNGGSNKED
ncbi:MAG TPA: response regulator [Nitrososphaeraceae archaeon]|nr:response regulator [Nitrososphaeraceae archaeon]